MLKKLIATAIVAALTVSFGWFALGSPVAAQQTGVQFSISVPGVDGCTTISGDATCSIAQGSRFFIAFNLDSLPPDVPEHSGYDAFLPYTGVTPQGNPQTEVWPECAFPAIDAQPSPGELLFTCVIGPPADVLSTFTGTLATVEFSCDQSGSVAIRHGSGYTDLVGGIGFEVLERTEGTENLTVNCEANGARAPEPTQPAQLGAAIGQEPGEPAEPRPTATPGPGSTQPTDGTAPAGSSTPNSGQTPPDGGQSDDSDGGSNTWLIVAIIVIAVAAAGGIAWRYRRGRSTPGGGQPTGSEGPPGSDSPPAEDA